MVLLAGDIHGDLCSKKDIFLQSLQKHTFNNTTNEISFDSGITLNVTQVLTGCEVITMANLRLLFNRKKLRTVYYFWSDNETKLTKIKRPNIVGIGGEVTRLKDISPIYCLRLYLRGHKQQQIFDISTTRQVEPIFKDGEKYPTAEYQGWKYV